MTDREKLIELLLAGMGFTDNKQLLIPTSELYHLADYLLTNGVVVRDKGEWIPLKDMVKGDTIYHCSKCWTKTGKRRRKRYNFCPNCGAKMDGRRRADND